MRLALGLVVGRRRGVPWPTPQQIAQEQHADSVIDLRICDSRDVLSKSLLMADESLANTAFVDYGGMSVLDAWATRVTADVDVERIVVQQNVALVSSKIDPVDWDCRGSVAEFLGTTLPSSDLDCRLTQHAFSTTTNPNFAAQLAGQAGTLRGLVYGLPGKVQQDGPGLAVWWRNSNAQVPSDNAPISEYYDYGSLAAGEYAEVSVHVDAGWTNGAYANLGFNWVAEPGAMSANGELAALSTLIVERDGPGVTIYNPSVGGTTLDQHWLNTDVVPAAFWSEVLPRLVGNRKLHLTIDIGTNGGNSDPQFAEHMIELIGLVRAAVLKARVVIRTAYMSTNDPPAMPYVDAIYDGVLGVVPMVMFLDTRAVLGERDPDLMPDGVHRNEAGIREQGRVIDAMIESVAQYGQHSCNIATDLASNPLQVGVPYQLTGRCWPANESVAVTINGVQAGIATGSGKTWALWVTPTEEMRGGGVSVDVVVTPGGVTAMATTRPTMIAAAV